MGGGRATVKHHAAAGFIPAQRAANASDMKSGRLYSPFSHPAGVSFYGPLSYFSPALCCFSKMSLAS